MVAAPAQAYTAPQLHDNQQSKPVASDADLAARASAWLKAEGEPGTAESPKTSADTSTSGTQSTDTPDKMIIGGSNAPYGEAPWMTQLYGVDPATGQGFFCGGALIAPAKVLTAAHCVDGANWPADGLVVAGATTLLSAGPDFHGGKPARVTRQWVHPSYDHDVLNDVAVLTLDRPLPFKTLQTVTPTDTASYTPGTTGVVYGWGRTSGTPGSGISTYLKKASLPVQDDSKCTSFPVGQQYFVKGSMFCAGTPAGGTDDTTVSPCNGDSGGPLIVNGRIAGVVSWGVNNCIENGAYPVFSKVSTFAGKINQRADDANFTDDNKADLFARNKSTKNAVVFPSRGTSLGSAITFGDYSNVSLWRQTDLDRDGSEDEVFRTLNGDMYWFRWKYNESTNQYDPVETRIGTGWGKVKTIVFPGDVTGDGFADMLSVDYAGILWTYPGKGNGTWGTRMQGGSGWGSYVVVGKGDFSGDGKADMLVRDTAGRLWMYLGRGVATAPFSNQRVQVGSGWNFTAYAAPGDVTGDGAADLVVRDSAGSLYLYPSRNSATVPFKDRVKIGSGWNSYDMIG
ncbi:hypothetical protein GCM10020367_44530 [Streptomyces sannanensis]|uniref:Peptidase S1 domain-containing protein n=1 Tax=Streptomyces sannanensis TaxID=285536 RepID=A0ABP6SFR7_9ACTN